MASRLASRPMPSVPQRRIVPEQESFDDEYVQVDEQPPTSNNRPVPLPPLPQPPPIPRGTRPGRSPVRAPADLKPRANVSYLSNYTDTNTLDNASK